MSWKGRLILGSLISEHNKATRTTSYQKNVFVQKCAIYPDQINIKTCYLQNIWQVEGIMYRKDGLPDWCIRAKAGSAPHAPNHTSHATKPLEKMMNDMHKTDALVFQNDDASNTKMEIY